MTELLPCPFCNSLDDLQVTHTGAADEWWWHVFCDACATDGPSNPTRELAIAAWNTRPASVDDEMVERAARAMFDNELSASPLKVASEELWGDERSTWLNRARAALAAVKLEGVGEP